MVSLSDNANWKRALLAGFTNYDYDPQQVRSFKANKDDRPTKRVQPYCIQLCRILNGEG